MATLLDGKKLAEELASELKKEISAHSRKLSLAVIRVGDDAVVSKFIAKKERLARDLGVGVRVYAYEAGISTSELRKRISVIVHEADPTGIIIQLPLPGGIQAQHILNSVPPEKDVDVLSARSLGNFFVGKAAIAPPVVGAIQALFGEYAIEYRTKHVLIVGAGMLVGKPVATWLLNEKVSFSVADVNTADMANYMRQADIVISGVGKPALITGDMVKDGVIVVDAGTSEVNGKLSGDVDFGSVAPKAAFITPVPGGVGPLTVVMLFNNLLILIRDKKHI